MATKIFVNLPVKDLDRSVAFFTKLGYRFNPQFTNESATCMIISDDIFVMLLVEPFFKSFTKKEIPDTSATAQAIIALSAESREAVDKLVGLAMEAGAGAYNQVQDQGFMYVHGFEDLDGQIWEIMWMDPAAIQG
jgi:predicted lactoylglutathione lyase